MGRLNIDGGAQESSVPGGDQNDLVRVEQRRDVPAPEQTTFAAAAAIQTEQSAPPFGGAVENNAPAAARPNLPFGGAIENNAPAAARPNLPFGGAVENNAPAARPTAADQPNERESKFSALTARLRNNRANYRTFLLPSRGLLNPEIDGGKIMIRQMTGNEERILATPGMVANGESLNEIFRLCTRGADPMKLTTPDRHWLLYAIRMWSYGTLYHFDIRCPLCGEITKDESYNLDALTINYAEDTLKEPFEIELPSSGLIVRYRADRGEDEVKIQDRLKRKKKDLFGKVQEENPLDVRALMLITEIIDGDQSYTEPNAIRTIWELLDVGDRRSWAVASSEMPFGLNTQISLDCRYCGHEYETPLPSGMDFFFPRKVQKMK